MQRNPLDCRIPCNLQFQDVHNSIWHIPEATMEAMESFGQDKFQVVSKGLDFYRMGTAPNTANSLSWCFTYVRVVVMRKHVITTGVVLVAEVP